VGRVAKGLRADLVVLQGNPSQRMGDVRNVELVFKDGVAYDPERLVAAAAGTLGKYTLERVPMWPIVGVLTLLAVSRARRIHRRRRLALVAH
jgi:hypothetical protein